MTASNSQPTTNNFIPVNTPLLDGNELKYVTQAIETGWVSSEGPFVKQFESELAQATNRKFGIAVCNGTAALELAVSALNLPEGSEVIMPAFTIISCALALVRNGLTPVLVDADPHTFNMDPSLIEEKITPKTSAIMAVHIFGLPCDLNPILSLAKKHNLKVIEDAAEMIGQNYCNQPCGSFGDVSIFSFYPNKHITTGEGGMVLTNDPTIAERAHWKKNLCFDSERRFIHDEIGYNFRMTNLQAALGLAQLESLPQHVKKKRDIGGQYNLLLKDTPGLKLPSASTDYAESIYWVYGLLLTNELDAVTMIQQLKQYKIGARHFFTPMHRQPCLQKLGLFQNESYPVSELIAEKGFYIPSGLGLTAEEIDITANILKSILS